MKYHGYGIWFDPCGTFSFPNSEFGKNTVIFGVGNSLKDTPLIIK